MNKLYKQNIKTEESIGRAKTILVSNEGPAIISSIIVRSHEYDIKSRIVFTGIVGFEAKLKEHISSIILPHVDEITTKIGLPLKSYDISAQNIGAVSTSDIGFQIKGYSADVPIFLAIFSASLQLPIKQDTVFTGHISSKKGDIAQVKNLIEKSEAAQREVGITEFVYPSLNKDGSLKVLKPKEFERAVSAIRSCRGKINLTEVTNIEELVKKTISDEAIVQSSLQSEYYDKNDATIEIGNHSIVKHLCKNNIYRFWKSLEENLINKQIDKVHKLLNLHLLYHIKQNKYPNNFGVDLRNLIYSLPLSSKKAEGLFPIITKDQYIKLIQYAKESDYEDISHLHDVIFNKVNINEKTSISKESGQIKNNITSEIIDYILEKLNPINIDTTLLKPIDEARANYIIDKIRVDSYEELIESIANFYIHILRRTNNESIKTDKQKLLVEALDLFKKTYPQKSKYEFAISNGINGFNGGIRKIFDQITEYLKIISKEKYIESTINEFINPLDFDLKKSLIDEIIKREKHNLDVDERLLIPEKYIDNYDKIIKLYSNSKNALNNIFVRL